MGNESDAHQNTTGKDHDLLIRIDENVKAIRKEQADHAASDKEMFEASNARLNYLEITHQQSKGAWKATSAISAVIGAIVGFIVSLLKH